MDAYQHVRDGTRYLSVLLTTELNDPCVSSWEPTKMAARLQAANASNNPMLLRIETDAGHGISSPAPSATAKAPTSSPSCSGAPATPATSRTPPDATADREPSLQLKSTGGKTLMSSLDTSVRTPIDTIDPFRSVSPTWFALGALACFAVVTASFALPHRIWWIDYPGIAFHLFMFMLVAKLDAPDWAKAAGYGWLVLDVMVGVLTLNHLPPNIYFPIRLGGHIFAGTWITMVSLSAPRAMKIVGVITGVWLAGYSFVSPFVSGKALAPNSLLILVWLGIIAWRFRTRSPSLAV